MKATEVQIGDWMQTKSGLCFRVMQIEGIIEDYVMLEDGSEDFEPIPLTPEILEKNGWKNMNTKKDCYEYVYIRYDVTFAICKTGMPSPYIRFGGFYLCSCNYVHELQRALRLCELKELANNLVV